MMEPDDAIHPQTHGTHADRYRSANTRRGSTRPHLPGGASAWELARSGYGSYLLSLLDSPGSARELS